jgi:acetyl-CoA synthetase
MGRMEKSSNMVTSVECQGKFQPNLSSYEDEYRLFSWTSIKSELVFPDGKINAAYLAVDRHVPRFGDKVALFWEGTERRERYTFSEIHNLSNKFGNVLKNQGAQVGETIISYLPRIPASYVTALAITKIGGVTVPLFSAFGPDALSHRCNDAKSKMIVTTKNLVETVRKSKALTPAIQKIVVVDAYAEEVNENEGEYGLLSCLDTVSDYLEIEHLNTDAPLYVMYTSGSTAKPKGVVHVHDLMRALYIQCKWMYDLHDEDLFWNTADLGWTAGFTISVFGAWSNGVSQLSYEGRFNADMWYALIEKYRVSVMLTSSTAVRMLKKAGEELPKKYDLSSLRLICAGGESLGADYVTWSRRTLGSPVYEMYGQTETATYVIANYVSMRIKPGSIGKPMPGVKAAVIDEKGSPLPSGQIGMLALEPGPYLMKEILNQPERYKECFCGRWYLTNDLAYKDDDGYFWYVGRSDDIIKTSGYRIGPAEIESVLTSHPNVANAGVIGIPDSENLRGQLIKAFIVLKDGNVGSEELIHDLSELVREKIGPHAIPKIIEFVSGLPLTRSGKIVRRVLRARELGLPLGDLSTLED